MRRHRRSVAFLVVLVAPLAAATWFAAAEGDEAPPTLRASALLQASEITGPHHTIEDVVETPGFYHVFKITSDYGPFEAVGRTQLAVRLQEIAALAALQEVSKSEVFLKAAGQSLVDVGKGAASAVTDPGGTAKGIGGGIKRMGVNLGRRTQRAVDSATGEDQKAEGDAQSGGSSAAAEAGKSLLGVNAAMRRWARKVGVDPYTTNPVLRKALEDIAKVDVSGGIATKVVVPIPAVVGTTASVGDLVWGKDPEELRKLNEQRARDLGVPDAVAKALFTNPAFTLTSQTRLIAALHAVRARGAGDYVASAAEAGTERQAIFSVESAEMLQKFHARSPVSAVLTDSRAVVAKAASGEAVALLPLDFVRWTSTAAATLGEIATRAKADLGATGLRLDVTGTVTERATKEFAAAGWRR
jgi:hypothetical protein